VLKPTGARRGCIGRISCRRHFPRYSTVLSTKAAQQLAFLGARGDVEPCRDGRADLCTLRFPETPGQCIEQRIAVAERGIRKFLELVVAVLQMHDVPLLHR
jgi:hypothetical protein